MTASVLVLNLERLLTEDNAPLDSIRLKASLNFTGSARTSACAKNESKNFLETNVLYNLVKFSPPCSGSVKSITLSPILTLPSCPPKVALYKL